MDYSEDWLERQIQRDLEGCWEDDTLQKANETMKAAMGALLEDRAWVQRQIQRAQEGSYED